MSIWMAMLIGAAIGVVLTTIILSHSRNGRIKAEYEQYIAELELEHQQALAQAQKRSVNTSRAVLKGKMAEQMAPIMPQFEYLPSDAKFLGDLTHDATYRNDCHGVIRCTNIGKNHE